MRDQDRNEFPRSEHLNARTRAGIGPSPRENEREQQPENQSGAKPKSNQRRIIAIGLGAHDSSEAS
jgi:hypothetical protein